MNFFVTLILFVISGAAVARFRQIDQAGSSDLGLSLGNVVEELQMSFRGAANSQESANMAAFLMMLRYCEGTAGLNGYRMLFGGQLFDSYDDHPRRAMPYRGLWTTAAGAYQMMAVSPIPTGGTTRVDTWDRLKAKLGLVDFSPRSQDAAAVQLIDEQGALLDVYAGRIVTAISKCKRVWASLPGAGYSQPERSLSYCIGQYVAAGGVQA